MPNKNGFTLIELSIVLVIIAAIISTITFGSSVITNSKIQTVIKEIQTHEAAIHAFREKFRYYPGDFSSAESYWGASTTDNGNANWQISGNTTESLLAWQHLSLAKLIKQPLTGQDAGTPDFVPGKNVASSIFGTEAHYFISYPTLFGRTGNSIAFATNGSDTDPYGPVLTPKQATKLDGKIDDGVANAGMIYGVDGTGVSDGDCSDAAGDAGADYDRSGTTTTCTIYYWLEKE